MNYYDHMTPEVFVLHNLIMSIVIGAYSGDYTTL